MPLSQRWTDAIFARMLVRYGAQWLRMWDGVPMEAVKADWARELEGLEGNGRVIQYALEHLPSDFPPNAAQFKLLCANRPEPEHKALPAPKADPERVKAALERMNALKSKLGPADWAHQMRDREKAGESLTETERTMWRAAVRNVPEPGVMAFKGIPDDVLPPGMRQGDAA
jgi:hypothetical protein